MNTIIKMALRGTVRNWRHTLATLNAIAVGVSAFILIHGYMVDAKDQFSDFYIHRSMYGHLIIEADRTSDDGDPWAMQMTEAENQQAQSFLDSLQGDIKNTLTFMPVQGIIAGPASSLNVFGLAYDTKKGEDMRGPLWRWNTVAGQPLPAITTQREIVVGRGLAELLGCDISLINPEVEKDGSYKPIPTHQPCFDQTWQMTALTESGQMNAYDVRISGIVDAGLRAFQDSSVMMSLTDAQTFYDSKRSSMIGVELVDPAQIDAIQKTLTEAFRKRQLNLKVTRWDDHSIAEIYRSNVILLEIFQNFVLLIVIVVCTLALSNTILRNIMKRTREIACLRAIGFKRRMIVILFTWEGFFLGLMGSLVGCVIAVIIGGLISAAGYTYVPGLISQPVPLRIALTPLIYFLSILSLSLLSALVASLIAMSRSKKNIAESLTHN